MLNVLTTSAVMLATSMSMLFLSASQQPKAQTDPDKTPERSGRAVRKVKSLDELRPTTDEERANAKHFDDYGASVLLPGDTGRRIFHRPRDWPGGRPTYGGFITRLACSRDTIVVGRLEPKNVN